MNSRRCSIDNYVESEAKINGDFVTLWFFKPLFSSECIYNLNIPFNVSCVSDDLWPYICKKLNNIIEVLNVIDDQSGK